MDCPKNVSVDEYIAEALVERQGMMQAVRKLIFETAPEAEETIGQRMPSYKLYGKQLAYFANGKNHIGFFVDSKIIADNQAKLKGYVTCNSGFQLRLDESLPLDLMREFLVLKIEMIKNGTKKK
ncbi:MAG: DUF1801 domain-containing protein [Clostridiales bacterium]|jgi:uncharacterized protein YdhG (YjbR/CyaY superfamily)|nr:DUF1801 domain-containing protein [Clostridiales bacterium]